MSAAPEILLAPAGEDPAPPPDRVCPRCRAVAPASAAVCDEDATPLITNWSGRVVDGRYAIGRLLGVGGMGGGVWEAVQRPLDRVVAVKLGAPTGDDRRRFLRGAGVLAHLAHPHITVMHDQGEADGVPFVVMERLRGAPLDRFLSKRLFGPTEAVRITCQLLDALDHVHARGYIHRDVKPGNLFLGGGRRGFHVKLTDFGIARHVREHQRDPHADVTREREICGTPHYMAPEQVVGSRIDARADLYAAGVCLFRMLSGGLPFDGESRRDIYAAKLCDAPLTLTEAWRAAHPRPTTAPPSYDPALEAIIRRSLRTLAHDRYPSAIAFLEALQPFA